MNARLVVLVSGAGTNLQALLDACADPAYGATVVAVGADRESIAALDRAKAADIPTFTVNVEIFAAFARSSAAIESRSAPTATTVAP